MSDKSDKRVTGIGGIFFKVKNPDAMREWYHKHLRIEPMESWGAVFQWREHDRPERVGQTVWSVMPHDTEYFDRSRSPFMINYRVDDLDAVLEKLRAEGVEVDDRIEDSEFGRFGWVMDPEGNRIELWQPPEPE